MIVLSIDRSNSLCDTRVGGLQSVSKLFNSHGPSIYVHIIAKLHVSTSISAVLVEAYRDPASCSYRVQLFSKLDKCALC